MNTNVGEFNIKRLRREDVLVFQHLLRLFEEVFETGNHETARQAYLENLLDKPEFIVYAALYKNQVVGGLTAYVLPMYNSERPEIFIYDIAVSKDFQRKGCGKKLLLTLEAYCRENKIRMMFVAAHEEDKHAVDFYRSTGGKAEKVIHFNYESAIRV